MVAAAANGAAGLYLDGARVRRATIDGISRGKSDRCVHGLGNPEGGSQGSRSRQPDSAGGADANVRLEMKARRLQAVMSEHYVLDISERYVQYV